MSKFTCSPLFGESSVPPSEMRGPLNKESSCGDISSARITAGETKDPVACTPTTDRSTSSAVFDSRAAEILKLVFERTIKGTRMTGDAAPVPDNVIRTVLPLLTTSMSILF